MQRLPLLPAFVLSLTVSGTALAAAPPPDDASPERPSAVAVAPTPKLATERDPDALAPPKEVATFKPLSITLNPLSLVLSRIGANVEYLPAPHHAIMLNPFFQSLSLSANDSNGGAKTTYTNFGAELGYHFYSGTKGANGFYVGPSLVLWNSSVSTSASATANGNTQNTNASSSIFVYGAALDVGAQHIFDNGFTIGGGAGVMYLTASNTTAASSSSYKVSGTLPRFLFTIGYSF
jgi:hypothetical protein